MTEHPPRRILVTGASGLLGSTLAPTLARAGHRVVTHALRRSADATFDLTDEARTLSELDRMRPEVILNLVALTSVEACESDPVLARRMNVLTVENLARWTSRNPGTLLVQVSTDMVYDGAGEQPEEAVRLTNQYAITKHAGEEAALAADATVLRTNFFGPSRVDGRPSLSDWILGRLRSGQPTPLFRDIQFSPLSLDTLGEMMLRVVAARIPGTYNLGSHGGMSKSAFGLALAAAHGLPTTHAEVTDSRFAVHRPKDMRMDVTRFERSFGVRLPTLLDEIRRLAGGQVPPTAPPAIPSETTPLRHALHA